MIITSCIITYNQEGFIAQAIEGALSQKLNYEHQILISDDCSTDRTFQICEEYARRHPQKIRLLQTERNSGMIGNWIFAINSCSSKYIAICEGDDYWTDPYKLQKQVDFLEANKNYSICFHETMALHKEGEYEIVNIKENKTFEFSDLAQGNFIPTASSVFPKYDLLLELNSKFENLSAVDWAIHLLNAQYGKIYYMKDNMAVYRINDAGIWSSLSRNEMIKKTLKLYDELNDFFDFKYDADFAKGKQELMKSYQNELKLSKKNNVTFIKRIKRKFKKYIDYGKF